MTHDDRDQARASARAAADRAHAMRRASDALWLSGDRDGAERLASQAREIDTECDAYCAVAARLPRTPQ